MNQPSELELYIQNQPELVKKYKGQIIALHHGQVEGVFDTKLDALMAMKATYAPGDFFIIKCTPRDSEYTFQVRSFFVTHESTNFDILKILCKLWILFKHSFINTKSVHITTL